MNISYFSIYDHQQKPDVIYLSRIGGNCHEKNLVFVKDETAILNSFKLKNTCIAIILFDKQRGNDIKIIKTYKLNRGCVLIC